VTFLAPAPDAPGLDPWDRAAVRDGDLPALDAAPAAGVTFAGLPATSAQAKSWETWARALKAHVLQTRALRAWWSQALRAASRPGESEGDFRARLALSARERRDAEIERIRRLNAPKVATLQDRIRAAEARVGREEAQVSQARWQAASSFGSAVLGVLFGRKLTGGSTSAKASRAARGIGRVSRNKDDLARAEADVAAAKRRLADLTAAIEADVAAVRDGADPARLLLEELIVPPRRADVAIRATWLVWAPWCVFDDGRAEAAFEF
jgi:hypothetical protein